jgi:hypothetical protein
VLATVKDLRAGKRGGLRPSSTAAARGTCGLSGRDEETASFSQTKKRHQVAGAARWDKGQSLPPTQRSEEAQITIDRPYTITTLPPRFPPSNQIGRIFSP